MHHRSKFALVFVAVCAGTTGALAHPGHGLSGSHWHATDTWGWLAAGAIAALAYWLSRNRK